MTPSHMFWGASQAALVFHTKANLLQPLSLQFVCNQSNHSMVKQPTCFCSVAGSSWENPQLKIVTLAENLSLLDGIVAM